MSAVCLFGAQTEFEAFITVDYIIKKLNWKYIFKSDMQKVKSLMDVFEEKLEGQSTSVDSLLRGMNVEPIGFMCPFFVTCLAYNLEVKYCV